MKYIFTKIIFFIDKFDPRIFNFLDKVLCFAGSLICMIFDHKPRHYCKEELFPYAYSSCYCTRCGKRLPLFYPNDEGDEIIWGDGE